MKLKNFFNKWKRQNKICRVLYLVILFLYLVACILFTRALANLSGIETPLRMEIIFFCYFYFCIYLFTGIILLFTKKNKRFITLLVVTFLFVPAFTIATIYIDRAYNIIDSVQKKYVDYSSVMISMKDTQEYNKIGMISAKEDPTGYVIPKDMIEKYDIEGEIIYYDDYISMMADLYENEIDALFISADYVTMFSSYETFTAIDKDTKIVYEMTKKLENVDNVTYSTKKLTEPFSLLLMGVDATEGNVSSGSFNGDSLMLITFNPKTLNATIFSIPRDTYVPISCRGGAENKINSSAYGGTSCVVKTIEDLTGIKIDYYVKVNFEGVVKIVDDLGGINVDVPVDFCEQNSHRQFGEYLICLEKGYQRLDGEQALALARHRHSLPTGDFQRVQHQQLVVEAIVNEVKNIKNVESFYKILDDISDNVDTNISTNQILSLYDVAKNVLLKTFSDDTKLSIQKTYLTGYDLTMYMPSMRSYIYTFQYYKSSLDAITNAMKVNLEIEKPKLIKHFDYDANETYELSIIGKNTQGDKKRELLPNFVGSTREYAESWATERGITVSIREEDSSTVPSGQVISQSVHEGQLADQISSIEFVISKNALPTTSQNLDSNEPETNSDDEPEEEKVPNFVGKTVDEFKSWKNSLKGANLITEEIPLSITDILDLGVTDYTPNTIYKQSIDPGTKLSDVSTLKIYYYKEA